MSLLLDALKRAEQEKLARGDRAEPEPAPKAAAHAAAAPVAPNLELHPISPPPGGGAGVKPPPGPQAAQVVFQAKTAPAANEPRGRSMLIGTIVGGILIVVVAAAAYVWHTIRTLTPNQVATTGPRPPAAPVPSPAGAPPSVQSGTVFVPTEPAPIVPGSTAATPSNPSTPSAPPAPAPGARPAELAVTQAPKPSESARALQEVLAANATAAPPLRLERSAEPPRVPRDIATGYEALARGDLEAARRSYQAALATDGASVDALLGMATVEAQSGNRGAAAAHYRRVLEGDGRNATALAGLAALADHSRPEALEARLRDDLARAPDSAPLRFALGNLYASQRRWTEAQAEYFEAYRLDPTVGDVMHNLAVSLDHLGQTRLAAQFYARALEAAQRQATHFDPAPVARRLAELGR